MIHGMSGKGMSIDARRDAILQAKRLIRRMSNDRSLHARRRLVEQVRMSGAVLR